MKISLDRSDFTPKIWVTGVKITRKIQFTGVIYRSDHSHSCHFDILGKSPGADQICSEFLKAGGPMLISILERFFNAILSTGDIPQNFKEALIVVLFKKDDRLECKNYCPISLLSHIYKLFMTIIGDQIRSIPFFSTLSSSLSTAELLSKSFAFVSS